MKRCRRCLLPEAAPGGKLDSHGICQACREYELADIEREERIRRERAADLEAALADCRGRGEYDCLVNLSGGKDSCYLLYRLKADYGLNVLAFTTNMNVPRAAWANIHRTIERLGVPHLVFTPPREFYRKLYRYLLQNQEQRGAVRTVCYVCAPLFEGYALRVAVEKRIPLVLAGYSPGQPEPDRMTYEFSRELICRTDWTPPELRASGLFSPQELSLFWNPFAYPADTSFPRYLAPFHAWPYDQTEIMRRVVELGLAATRRTASPVHSNCPVNWLLMFSDLKHLGYNPYAPEFSRLIREGKASRGYWRWAGRLADWMIRHRIFLGREVQRSLAWLGLCEDDLRITRPCGSGPGECTGAQSGFVPVEAVGTVSPLSKTQQVEAACRD